MELAVVAFSWLVDFLLLVGVNRLYPVKRSLIRLFVVPMIGAAYALLSLKVRNSTLIPALGIGSVILSGVLVFGCRLEGLRCCTLYVLLRFAIVGAAIPRWILRPWPLLSASLLVLLLCLLGFPDNSGYFVPVELCYGTNHMSLTALRDTGNTLRDPVTGKPVLILGADAARNLTGLTTQQLRSPVESIGVLPGLRLIPYRSISGGGLLLALQLPMVRIGSRRSSALVAFAPEILSREGKFQALTGGM